MIVVVIVVVVIVVVVIVVVVIVVVVIVVVVIVVVVIVVVVIVVCSDSCCSDSSCSDSSCSDSCCSDSCAYEVHNYAFTFQYTKGPLSVKVQPNHPNKHCSGSTSKPPSKSGSGIRRFDKKWEETFPWLEFNENLQDAFC